MTQCMLLAVDGSQGGDRALEYSIAQLKDRGIKLIVAYVIEWSPYTFNTPEENAERQLLLLSPWVALVPHSG